MAAPSATDIIAIGDGCTGLTHGFPTGEETGLNLAVESADVTPQAGGNALRKNYKGTRIGRKFWDFYNEINFSGWYYSASGLGMLGNGIGAVIAGPIASQMSSTVLNLLFNTASGGKLILMPGTKFSLNIENWARLDLKLEYDPYVTTAA